MKDHHVPQEHLSAFAREAGGGGAERGDSGEVPAGRRGLSGVAGGGAGEPGGSHGLEGPLGPLRLPPRHHQLHAGRPQRLPPFHRPGGLPCPRPAGAAQTLSERGAGAEPPGVPAPAGHRPHLGPGPPGPGHGDHLRRRHPGQRGALYHCGGRPFRSGGYRPQGQGPHHPPPPASCAASCSSTPDSKKPLPARSLLTKAASLCPGGRSGRR